MVLVIDVSNDDALYNEVVAAAELCYETFHVWDGCDAVASLLSFKEKTFLNFINS